LQINLTGFLEKNTSLFLKVCSVPPAVLLKALPSLKIACLCQYTSWLNGVLVAEVGPLTACQELWVLLHSASSNASGIPQQILDEKAEEMRKKKEMQDAINVSFQSQIDCPVHANLMTSCPT
jgi:hypothetical protein